MTVLVAARWRAPRIDIDDAHTPIAVSAGIAIATALVALVSEWACSTNRAPRRKLPRRR